MNRRLIVMLLFAAPLLSTLDSRAATSEELRAPGSTESFDQVLPDSLLHGLYHPALAALQEYIEIDGALPQDGATQQRAGEFRLKLFPHGKSRSQEHLTTEGSFRLSPDAGQQEFILRFKSSKHPSRPLPPVTDDVI